MIRVCFCFCFFDVEVNNWNIIVGMKVNVVDEGLIEIICGLKFDEKEEK